MTPAEMAQVLAKAAAFDQRTVGKADVAAWTEAVGDLAYDDAMAAVTRHYRQTRERMWPADLRQGVLDIRNERARARHSEALALPSRFEHDPQRDARLAAGVARLSRIWSMPDDGGDDSPLARAIRRARQERRGREVPSRAKRRDTKPVDLDKLKGPDWASVDARERQAVDALHCAGLPCGRGACTADSCRRAGVRT